MNKKQQDEVEITSDQLDRGYKNTNMFYHRLFIIAHTHIVEMFLAYDKKSIET